VVDTGAVEDQHGPTDPVLHTMVLHTMVLHTMDHYLAHSDLHPRRLTARGANVTAQKKKGASKSAPFF
jgi:hypothetical protein